MIRLINMTFQPTERAMHAVATIHHRGYPRTFSGDVNHYLGHDVGNLEAIYKDFPYATFAAHDRIVRRFRFQRTLRRIHNNALSDRDVMLARSRGSDGGSSGQRPSDGVGGDHLTSWHGLMDLWNSLVGKLHAR